MPWARYNAAINSLIHSLNDGVALMHELLGRARILFGTILRMACDGLFDQEIHRQHVLSLAEQKKNRGKLFWQHLIEACEIGSSLHFKAHKAEGAEMDFAVFAAGIDTICIQAPGENQAPAERWPKLEARHMSKVVALVADQLMIEFHLILGNDGPIKDRLEELDLEINEPDASLTQVEKFWHLDQQLPPEERFAPTSRPKNAQAMIPMTFRDFGLWIVPLYQDCGNADLRALLQSALKESMGGSIVTGRALEGFQNWTSIFENIVCDFGGARNKKIRNQLCDLEELDPKTLEPQKYLAPADYFTTDGQRLHLGCYDLRKPKPTEAEVRSHADVRVDRVTANDLPIDKKPLDILGVDLGDTCPAAFGSILHSGVMKTMVVRKRAFYEGITRRSQRHLEGKKKEHLHVFGMEQQLAGGRSLDAVDFTSYAVSWTDEEKALFDFYNTPDLKKFRRLSERKKQKFYDLMFTACLQMVDMRPNQRVDTLDRHIVFVFGLGKFKTHHGLPSLHYRFMRYIVKKARAIGITCVGCDEFFTSQTCPHCLGYAEKIPDHHLRVTRCTKCGLHFHRDVMAALNHAIIAKYILEAARNPELIIPRRLIRTPSIT